MARKQRVRVDSAPIQRKPDTEDLKPQRCICGGELDDIGNDAIGWRYLWCASCGREIQVSPS